MITPWAISFCRIPPWTGHARFTSFACASASSSSSRHAVHVGLFSYVSRVRSPQRTHLLPNRLIAAMSPHARCWRPLAVTVGGDTVHRRRASAQAGSGPARLSCIAMWNRNLVILLGSQFIAVSGSVLIVTIGGLVGAALSSDASFATLPLSIMVVGTAVATVFAAMLMRRVGRRTGFVVGALIAAAGGLISAYGLYIDSFALFCVGVGLYGVNNAFVQQYRFAAAESVANGIDESRDLTGAARRDWRRVLRTVARDGRATLDSDAPLYGLDGRDRRPARRSSWRCCSVSKNPSVRRVVVEQAAERALRSIVAQPTYLVAMLASVVGYGVMNLVMTATPLSMHVYDGLSLPDTAWVIQSHVLAMYVPSLFSGALIARLGVVRVLSLGVVALLATIVFGLQRPRGRALLVVAGVARRRLELPVRRRYGVARRQLPPGRTFQSAGGQRVQRVRRVGGGVAARGYVDPPLGLGRRALVDGAAVDRDVRCVGDLFETIRRSQAGQSFTPSR